MKIKVTQEDIDNGEGGSPYLCPVALSIMRHTGATMASAFGHTLLAIKKEGMVETCVLHRKTPPDVLRFMEEFDAGLCVNPEEFDLGPDKLSPLAPDKHSL